MNEKTEKTIQTGTLVAIIIAFFIFNAVVSLLAGAFLHLVGLNDIFAIAGSILVSIKLWGSQIKLLSELIGD
jgi:hypothetical protein